MKYYSPEDNGLRTVGEIEWTDEPYAFDLFGVWRHEVTGQLYYGEDYGCSCPTPFEDHRIDGGADPQYSLIPGTKHEIASVIQDRISDKATEYRVAGSGAIGRAMDLIERLMATPSAAA